MPVNVKRRGGDQLGGVVRRPRRDIAMMRGQKYRLMVQNEHAGID